MSFADRIRPHVQAELDRARAASLLRQPALAFNHLERAHVLGQMSTVVHVRVHWHMLVWALRQRDSKEAFGQVLRLVAALLCTPLGLLPHGNTGGSDLSPVQRLPIPDDLAVLIEQARLPGPGGMRPGA